MLGHPNVRHIKMVDAARLTSRIEKAFAGVVLGSGVSLHGCEYRDSGGRSMRYLERSRSNERDDWRRVINDDLAYFQVTFSFTDLSGYRFYLPAYMIWTIRNFRTSDSFIADATVYACDPASYQFNEIPFVRFFDAKQLRAIMFFLQFCVENKGSLDGDAASDNLQKIRESTRSLAKSAH